jgi:hypothetical protein
MPGVLRKGETMEVYRIEPASMLSAVDLGLVGMQRS